MGQAIEVNETNFDKEVLQANVPVLVDFWAPWCGPCRMIAPTVEQLATELAGQAKVCKVNVDENQNLAVRYHVTAIPALMIFKGGQVVQKFTGVQSKDRLKDALVQAAS
ncbi:Thioredoxin [Thermogutta terrifontis]|jgi:thioredoxin 1|uniref:Thioredoxin n=1 Tax=Thermogutta terrifontis TaxID=1331910 RepID=A0A286RKP9_9BACT|nr:thioredoxin [Thermogutta terrifontis]ASV76543.1 Thioredoxin [Thermogutta terrifontis]